MACTPQIQIETPISYSWVQEPIKSLYFENTHIILVIMALERALKYSNSYRTDQREYSMYARPSGVREEKLSNFGQKNNRSTYLIQKIQKFS